MYIRVYINSIFGIIALISFGDEIKGGLFLFFLYFLYFDSSGNRGRKLYFLI